MIDDFIHLTQGELLIKYWWLWLIFIAIAVIIAMFDNKLRKDNNREFDKLMKSDKRPWEK